MTVAEKAVDLRRLAVWCHEPTAGKLRDRANELEEMAAEIDVRDSKAKAARINHS